MKRDIRDSEEFRVGRLAEEVARRHLEGHGLLVIPLGYIKKDDCAPVMTRKDERYVLPDLRAEGSADMRGWYEVKAKGECVWLHKAEQYRHGIPVRLWNQYVEFNRIVDDPVHLAFVQWKPVELIVVGAVDDLTPIPGEGSMRSFGENMMFFRPEEFEYHPVDLSGIARLPRRVSYSWDDKRGPWPDSWRPAPSCATHSCKPLAPVPTITQLPLF